MHRDEGGAHANHGSARCSRAGATAGGRTEMRESRPRKVGVPCQDHLRECSRRAVYRRASKHQIVGKSWHFFGGVGAERPRRPRAGAWHRPKSPASTAWTFSLAISGGPPPRKV